MTAGKQNPQIQLIWKCPTSLCVKKFFVGLSSYAKCQTPSKTQTDKRTNGPTDKRTDVRNRIWYILALECDIWWQYFNDFPGNQLTKLRVFIAWSLIFISPLKFLWSIAFRPPCRLDAPVRHNGQTKKTKKMNGHVSLSLRLCLRWRLTPNEDRAAYKTFCTLRGNRLIITNEKLTKTRFAWTARYSAKLHLRDERIGGRTDRRRE